MADPHLRAPLFHRNVQIAGHPHRADLQAEVVDQSADERKAGTRRLGRPTRRADGHQGRTGRDAEALLALGRVADQGLRDLLPDFMPYQLHFDPGVRDKYGRTPGDLLDDRGRWLSVRLVEAGYAIPRGTVDARRRVVLQRASELARSEARGLWGSSPDDFSAWAGVP